MDEANLPSDYNHLGAMEFFILSLVGRVELRSLYELRQKASLEPGAIRSAIATLEAGQLISRTAPGKRRRRELTLTERGSLLLEDSWPKCLREYADTEAVLRAVLVGWVMAGPGAAADYLKWMGHSRQERALEMQEEAKHLTPSKAEALPGYAWMRAFTEASRRTAESEALLSISHFITESFNHNASARR